MNAVSMSTYIEYVADRLLKSIGEKPIFKANNPYDFMVNQSLDGKASFFEVRVGDYGKLTTVGTRSASTRSFRARLF